MRRPHQRRLQDRRTERQLWRGPAPADAAAPAPADGVTPLSVSPLRAPDRPRAATWVAVSARGEAA